MIGIQFRKSVARYLALRWLGPRWPALYTSFVSPVALRELPEPALPSPQWVRIRPLLTGICGSDLAAICAKGSPYLSPLTSTPFVLGHEVVGTVTEVGPEVDGIHVGQRVVIQPALGCEARGIQDLCEACAVGRFALCRNVTRGTISPGIQTGFCRDTGGGWSESLVAHASQVYVVPASVENEVAVLAEPLACALHAVLRAGLHGGAKGAGEGSTIKPQGPPGRETVLVMGCGAIGLLTIVALRAAGCSARVVAVAKYPHQQELARQLGADQVLPHERAVDRRFALLAEALGAELHRPEMGKPTVIGGARVTFDCVASSMTIDECIRFTAAGGTMVLVGMPSIPSGVDWTTIWYKELLVQGAYAYGREAYAGRQRTTFDLALDLLVEHGASLRGLVGAPFVLRDYRQALRTALHAGATGSVKTVFRIDPG